MTKQVIKVIKKKHASWKKYTRLKRNKDYQEYVIQRNETTRICRNARIKYERLLIDTFKDTRITQKVLRIHKETTKSQSGSYQIRDSRWKSDQN